MKLQIRKKDERLAIYIDGKLDIQGFMTIEDALHAYWTCKGAIPNHFYNADSDGIVSLEVRDE